MLGKRIKNLRTLYGMSQRKLADELSKRIGRELSGDAVGLYEREERRVTSDVLEALADIFNCSIDYLVGRSDIEGVADNDEFAAAIAAMFRAQKTLSPEEKVRLIKVLKAGWPDLFKDDHEGSTKS